MKKKKLLALLLASAMMAGMMAGCGSPSDGGAKSGSAASGSAASGGASDGKYSIDVILKTTSSEYWSYVVAGAKAYAKDNLNVTVDVKGATSETAYDEQLNMVETDVASDKYDGFVIAPLQADMVANKIKGTTKPIVAVDTAIDAPEVLSFVGTGNEAAGALGGKAAAEAAKTAGWTEIKAIEIAGVQGDSTNTARMAGYKKGIEEAGGVSRRGSAVCRRGSRQGRFLDGSHHAEPSGRHRDYLREQRRYGDGRRACREGQPGV